MPMLPAITRIAHHRRTGAWLACAFVGWAALASTTPAGENEKNAPPARLHVNGTLRWTHDGANVGRANAFAFGQGWKYHAGRCVGSPAGEAPVGIDARRKLAVGARANELAIDFDVQWPVEGKSGRLHLRFQATKDAVYETAGFEFQWPAAALGGRPFVVDEKEFPPPDEPKGDNIAIVNQANAVRIPGDAFGDLTLTFEKPVQIVVTDNKSKTHRAFGVRVQPPGGKQWKAGEVRVLSFDFAWPRPPALTDEQPFVVTADDTWIPMPLADYEIEPGSALDLSAAPWRHAPAGRFGALQVDPANGHFVFEGDPDRTPRRFFGTNLSYSANFLEGDGPERLARRFAAMGYNTVRLHHLDEMGAWMQPRLIAGYKDGAVQLNPDALDLLDRMFAAMKKEGLYVTIDLLVNWRGPVSAVWPEAANPNGFFDLRHIALVNDRAFDLWAAFAKALLTHVNPHTGLTWAEDPALAWICLSNEGNVGNQLDYIRGHKLIGSEFRRAWNAWLVERLAVDPDAVTRMGYTGDPANNEIPFAEGVNVYWVDNDRAARRFALLREFLVDIEKRGYAKMRDAVRALSSRALLTNSNGWIFDPLSPVQRGDYDFVDSHAYADAPSHQSSPRRYANPEPASSGVIPAFEYAWLRVPGRPFTLTELNQGNPSRYRAALGISTYAFAAMQDWDGIWRFAYAHDRNGDRLFKPAIAGMHPLDIQSDPIQLHAERAGLFLFARGDVPILQPALLARGTRADFAAVAGQRISQRRDGKDHQLLQPVEPRAQWLAAGARIAMMVDGADADRQADAFAPERLTVNPRDLYAADAEAGLWEQLAARGWTNAALTVQKVKDRAGRAVQVPGVVLDPTGRQLRIDTPRTAALCGPAGAEAELSGGVRWTLGGADAAAWVSSLDAGAPVASARRLLVTHLTDVLATRTTFEDSARKALIADGGLPWLAMAGTAELTIRRAPGVPALRAWALDFNGRRHEEIPVRMDGDALSLSLSVRGRDGANLLYELAER